MEQRIRSHARYNLYNSNRRIVLEDATPIQMARYLKYKNSNSIRAYIKLGKSDLKDQKTHELFYFKEAIYE